MLIKTFIYRAVVITALLLTIISCEKNVHLKLPEPTIKPVISAYASAYNPISLNLQRTYSITTSADKMDEGIYSFVDLWVNGHYQEQMSIKKGIYLSQFKPMPKDTVAIKLIVDGLQISAKAIIPKAVTIDSCYFAKRDELYDEKGAIPIKLVFDDDSGQDNYYETLVCHNFINKNSDTIHYYPWVYDSRDLIIVNEELLHYEPRTLVFSDELLSPKNNIIRFLFYRPYPKSDEYYLNTSVYLLKVTNDYYEYKKSYYKHKFLQNKGIFDSQHEPVPVFTNVVNGYGIFGAYSIDSVLVFVENFLP